MGVRATNSKKKIFSDSALGLLGLSAMHAALQIAVYPFLQRRFGESELGNILYLISLMNVFCVSMGVSLGYARIKTSADGKAQSTAYLVLLGAVSIAAIAVGAAISRLGTPEADAWDTALLSVLSVLTLIRYYADVEYKLTLNFGGLCKYYLMIALGYLFGILLTLVTSRWALSLICGEAFGIAYALARGRVLFADGRANASEIAHVTRLTLVIFTSEALSSLIFNSDRIILKLLISSSAVTLYYLASLLGKTVALLTVSFGGVLIGYLARFEGTLTPRAMRRITYVCALGLPVGTLALTAASYVFVPLLYPDQLKGARPLFLWANGAQVAYFFANVITLVLLRFGKPRYQLYVNVSYAALFVLICIPSIKRGGLYGFCTGLAAVCLVRLAIAVSLGFFTAAKHHSNG